MPPHLYKKQVRGKAKIMNEIILQNKNTITTLEIAEMLEMRHQKIIEKLEGTKDGKLKELYLF